MIYNLFKETMEQKMKRIQENLEEALFDMENEMAASQENHPRWKAAAYTVAHLTEEVMEASKANPEAFVPKYMTINEIRKTMDLPPFSGGDIPLNPTYLKKLEAAHNKDTTLVSAGSPHRGELRGARIDLVPVRTAPEAKEEYVWAGFEHPVTAHAFNYSGGYFSYSYDTKGDLLYTHTSGDIEDERKLDYYKAGDQIYLVRDQESILVRVEDIGTTHTQVRPINREGLLGDVFTVSVKHPFQTLPKEAYTKTHEEKKGSKVYCQGDYADW